MNDRLFPVPYGLLAGLSQLSNIFALGRDDERIPRLAWRHLSDGRPELRGDPIGPGEINRARAQGGIAYTPLRKKNQNGLLVR